MKHMTHPKFSFIVSMLCVGVVASSLGAAQSVFAQAAERARGAEENIQWYNALPNAVKDRINAARRGSPADSWGSYTPVPGLRLVPGLNRIPARPVSVKSIPGSGGYVVPALSPAVRGFLGKISQFFLKK